ncbi:unnamed protein product [Medioppia subpectinata]|uniref:Uncharacterized protein n=1 Tax=Medioppia subpectinata TaxID=1979941 RepID=A0A7R9LRP6_9ACAR|nr:unnamed protein product [Medioppia subpectinata]CAG2121139.1 unnamed protein product [Medioppia subpectinata]
MAPTRLRLPLILNCYITRISRQRVKNTKRH